ncbi:MAG TPA: hypothetical protein V6D12_14850, partial [Candidatus Obscuribacterales bacterium]
YREEGRSKTARIVLSFAEEFRSQNRPLAKLINLFFLYADESRLTQINADGKQDFLTFARSLMD